MDPKKKTAGSRSEWLNQAVFRGPARLDPSYPPERMWLNQAVSGVHAVGPPSAPRWWRWLNQAMSRRRGVHRAPTSLDGL
jgi:hypothetical protein